jgi:hypothetical protein
MLDNNIDLIVSNKNGKNKRLNPLLSASNSLLKQKYHIDINKIHEKYEHKEYEER